MTHSKYGMEGYKNGQSARLLRGKAVGQYGFGQDVSKCLKVRRIFMSISAAILLIN